MPSPCQSVLTVFFPIKEGNCFYPARGAEILPSPVSKSWGFQQNPQGCRVWQARLSPGQMWPAKAAELGVPTPHEPWHGASGYLVSSSATLH